MNKEVLAKIFIGVDVIEGVKLAIEQFAEMKIILNDIIEYIDRKDLL